MPIIINVGEAKAHLSRLLERVRQGEEFILAKAGEPFARLVPLERHQERRPGLAAGRVTSDFFDPLPEEELEAWER
jgi:prevent-host-death family protein